MSFELSYVLVTDTFATIRNVVRAVSASSIASGVELVIVCPSERELGLDSSETTDGELRTGGGHFLIEPAARLMHLNIASLSGFLPDRFLSGRFWGTARSRHWSRARRLGYVLGAPLIPILIAGRAVRSRQWTHHRQRMPRGTLASVILGAVVTAAGELTAYVAGGGRAPIRLAEYELHRDRYL